MGFMTPTMSFPVADTLMIEPTESESKEEIDLFINALNSIYEEIKEIEKGVHSVENSPLRNAPHVHEWLLEDEWRFSYSKEKAYFPLKESDKKTKFWPSVARIDNVYGDKNLFCSCILPEMES